MNVGTKSHRLHKKAAIAREFVKGRRLWRIYWRLNKLILELGLEYSTRR